MKTAFPVRRRLLTALVAAALALPLLLTAGCGLLDTTGDTDESVKGGYTTGTAVSPEAPVSPEPHDSYSTDPQLGAPEVATEDSAGRQVAPLPGSGEDASTVPPDQRLIVRTVDMRVKVEDIEKSVDAVRKAVDERKGIVTDLQVSTDENIPIYRPFVEGAVTSDGAALSGYITVRVPADSLDSFIAEVGKLGDVLRESENESDVTQQHIDLSARLKNLQATEAQLRDFFSKAKNVTEMLAIEQELSRVRGEIEAMQAEIAYLERQAALSTVTVELVGPTPIVRPEGEEWGFVDALTRAVRGFVNTINTLIVLAGALAPVALLVLAGFYITRAVVRRKRPRVTAPEEIDDAEEQ